MWISWYDSFMQGSTTNGLSKVLSRFIQGFVGCAEEFCKAYAGCRGVRARLAGSTTLSLLIGEGSQTQTAEC